MTTPIAQGPVDVNVRLATLEVENEQLRSELAALRAKVFTNGDRLMKMGGRVFTVEGDGFILDNNFDFDAGLHVSGDFVDDEKNQYAQMIVAALNGPNVQVQRDSGSIIAGGSAGTTGSAT